MPAFEYQSIPSSPSNGTTPAPSSPSSAELCRRRVCSRGGAVGLIFALFSLWLYASKATHDASLAREPTSSSSLPATSARQGEDLQAVMHISDTHVDPYFDPTESMMKGVCHRCDFNSKVWGKDTACPDKSELRADHDRDDINRQLGYAFGRYGCNPPYMLWKSLHKHMQTIDADPKVIVFTGDISPHGYPDDKYKLKGDTTVDDLCETKFLVTRQMIRDLVRSFPNTKWAYTLGNNDHMPKNIYWQPYIDKYGKMLLDEGFFTPEQYDQFVNNGGANYVDVGHTRYLSLDFSLYMDGGEAEFKKSDVGKIRQRSNKWAEKALKDAKKKGMYVYIIGHQPLTTKKGKDEFNIEGEYFLDLKDLLTEYAPIIKVGLFGHRNVAGFGEVLNKDFFPLFPSLTAPGVSPRGRNQPSFNVLYQSKIDSTVMDFEQWKFDLQTENNEAARLDDPDYLGTWSRHDNDLQSWRILSGESNFTVASVSKYLEYVATSQSEFFDIEEWKRAGYIGDDTPESYTCKHLYDVEDMMMTCLFPNQDVKCWDSGWLT